MRHPLLVALGACVVALAGGAALGGDAACPFTAHPTALLNSERIERCYGNYGIELLAPVRDFRVARLYSGEPGRTVCRTLALTRLEHEPLDALAPALERIRAGASIGETLQDAGWRVGKRSLALTAIAAGPRFRAWSGLHELPGGAVVAMHVYLLTASANGRTVAVARIAELHHPDYLTADDLEILHPMRSPLGFQDADFLVDALDLIDR